MGYQTPQLKRVYYAYVLVKNEDGRRLLRSKKMVESARE